jgi:anti-anti-sigma factor
LLAAESKNPRHLVLDLTALGFIDSIGLRVVIAAWNRARHNGHAFSVALASSGQVRRVFELTGVDHIVPVADPRPA